LQKAFNGSTAGDVVCLRGGTYPSQSGTTYSQIMNNSGASGNPITFEDFPGEVAVVQGNTRVNGAFITFKGTAKVPPYGLVFQIGTAGLAINGIDVLNTHDVNFDHIELSGFDYHAAYNQSNGCNNKVLASYIHDNGIGTGVNGISWGSTAAGCTNGGLISNNVVEHNGSGIQLYSAGSTTIPANVTVEENTFVSSAGYGIVVWGDNNIVANNIAYGNGDALNDPQGTIHTGVANVVDHNVTFSPTSASRSGWYLSGGCCLSNNLVRDPLFISTSTKDWHLTFSSPALSFSNLNYVQPIDKDGVTRGPSFDAGAYQFVSVSLNPGTLTFESQTVGTTSTARQIALTNNGGAVLNINSISITGLNASDFAQSNTCGAAVAAGGTCTINVTFTPSVSGTRFAAVSIADNANGSPQLVSLTGSGE
jgi:parallel beta-helix repeat protein